jgi:cytochrome b561
MFAPRQLTIARYSATAQLLHWTTALLVVVAYIVSVGGPESASIRRPMISAAGCTSCSA